MEVFQASLTPVADNLAISAIVACISIASFFVCLAVFKLKAYVSALIALGVSIVIAIFAFQMPAVYALLSATQGAASGVLPICIIIIAAVWFYQVSVKSGRAEDLRLLFDNLGGGDVRIQVILIAFCFGSLLEALAGFGAPIAITASMVLILGVPRLKTAMCVLLANTVPVAFGTMAIPITTAAQTAPSPLGVEATAEHIAIICGHIIPFFSFIIPLLLVIILDGKQGLKDCWVPALVIGISFGLTQWLVSNYFAYQITDVMATLVSLLVSVVFLRFWKLRGVEESRARFGLKSYEEVKGESLSGCRIWMAVMPYAVVIALFAFSKTVLDLTVTDIKIPWPGLTTVNDDGTISSLVLNYKGNNPGTTFNFCWLSNCGTLMLIAGLIVTFVYMIFNAGGKYKLTFADSMRELGGTVVRMWEAFVTIAAVLALAYVMNFSGQTISIGNALANTGSLFVFLSPILGWIGTAITGSDTSANALFSAMQVEACISDPALAGVEPDLFLASNTIGGVIGKMVAPQSLAIAAAAVSVKESKIFNRVLPWSLGFLLVLCIIITLLAFPLNFLVTPLAA